MALLSYVNSDISKNNPLLIIWWKSKHEKNYYKNKIRTYQIQGRVVQVLLKTTRLTRKIKWKRQMTEMSREPLHHKTQKRARYMVMYIKLSAVDKTQKSCYQRISMAFHNCRKSKQLSRRQQHKFLDFDVFL